MTTSEQFETLDRIASEFPNKYAKFVPYDIGRYIKTGRSSADEEQKFRGLSSEQLRELTEKCLDGDLSSDGIIKTLKKYLKGVKA